MFSISPFRNSTLLTPALLLVFARQRQHVVGHVEAVGFAGGPHALRRKQDVDAAARAKIENDLAGAQVDQRGWIAAAERGPHRVFRKSAGLIVAVKVGRDGIAAAKAGIATCLHAARFCHCARCVSVLLLHFFLHTDRRFHDCISSYTPKRIYDAVGISVKTHIITV